MKYRSHDEVTAEFFRANPTYVEMLLADLRRDGDPAELAMLLRQLIMAFGLDVGRDAGI